MKVLAALTAATLLFVLAPAIATATPPPPSIQVSRTTGLAGGDQVRVTAHGFAPGSEVQVVQCDVFGDTPDRVCLNTLTVTAGATGRISTQVTLGDPVWWQRDVGQPRPTYCRADVCHLFAVGYDGAGQRLILESVALRFRGSPATISATPSTDLAAAQWVRVRGTAHGAEGHQVQIVERACFDIIQETGCYQPGKVVTTRVHSDGTYSTYYLAKRILVDGEDCEADYNLGDCVLSVAVLDSAGQPDDSFGVFWFGDMSTPLAFRTTN
ncbi:neocarzinostatin family protein [Kribbella voronezhensis]|uniref:Neocarzinostatin family protein n=1 Tax=Kribbella voronezhensis TaxID=2512212 RepID=A0A4V3FK47_9ACTN|nr:neocarzinostatin apoprotein domain-containing protein [Kribbella voronezhensis]TDU88763.1 neocarzinostatin family protein [Kribbella voronezhensis]